MNQWSTFLLDYCDIELEGVLTSVEDQVTLMVDGSLLLDYDLNLCSSLLSCPKTELVALNSAAVVAQTALYNKYKDRPDIDRYKIKRNVHVRLHNLPFIPELVRNRVPSSSDVGKYLLVNGTVIRTGSTKVLQREQMWRCSACQGLIEVEGKLEMRYKLLPPKKCSTQTCRGFKFKHLTDTVMRCYDYQEVKIQEKVERLDMGTIPRSMTVVLEHDLVDKCKAGDDVTVYGTVAQIWEKPTADIRCSLDTVIHANFIQVHNEDRGNLDVTDTTRALHYTHWRRYADTPMCGRNLLLASFCPDLYQLYIVKLAALLVMLGGVTHVDGRGTKVRGESHLLMVGDPGTGKSQILKYASKLSPRSVITTGVGCTSAGLTVAAVKDGGEWVLEAGAMVLADGGICCIDELGSLREHDRVAIHEAMEQQTISVAKAGLVCKLNTRTTVLAATNPRGSYDITLPISSNVPIGTPLLSRFDLILVLFDDHTPAWDSLVAGFLLKEQAVLEENNILKNYTADVLWTFEELQQYVSHVKTLKPKLTDPAKEVLGRYYRLQREQLSRNVSRTTIRMLESLVRLSQAHAKLMMREEVLLQDAIVTISLVESTMLNSSLLGSVSVLHSVFPADPELEYTKQKSMVLDVLKLPPNYGGDATNTGRAARFTPKGDSLMERAHSGVAGGVPSFHINTQELRSELQSIYNQQSSQVAGPSRRHPACNAHIVPRDDLVTCDTSHETTTTTQPLQKTSFAQLVKDFKAQKRAKTATVQPKRTADTSDMKCTKDNDDLSATIDGLIGSDVDKDLSAILSPDPLSAPLERNGASQIHSQNQHDTSEPAQNRHGPAEVPNRNHASDSEPQNRQNASENRHDTTENRHDTTENRQNTPVTKMYEKFDQLDNNVIATQENRTPNFQNSRQTLKSMLKKPISKDLAEKPLPTQYVNTQFVAVTSSILEHHHHPPPLPHFNISPVPMETVAVSRDNRIPVDDVTETELQEKTTRKQSKSQSSDNKLQKFAYKPRKRDQSDD